MPAIFKGQAGPCGGEVHDGQVGLSADGRKVVTCVPDGLGTVPESFREQVFVTCGKGGTLEGGQFRFGSLNFRGKGFRVTGFTSFNGSGFHVSDKCRDRNGIKAFVVHTGTKFTLRSPKTTVGMFGPAHGALAAGTPHDPSQQAFDLARPVRGGMFDLRGFPQFTTDERFMGGRVVPFADGDFPEVHAVADDLAGRGRQNVVADDGPDLSPRRTCRPGPECGTDLRGIRAEGQPPFTAFHVTGRDFRHGPDAMTDSSFFRCRYGLRVSFTLHRGQRQEDVTRHPSFGRGRVHVLRDGHDLPADGLDAFDHSQGRGHLHSRKTINLRDDHAVSFTAFDSTDSTVKDRPGRTATGHIKLWWEHLYSPALHLYERLNAFLLKLGGDKMLPSCYARDPRVSQETHGGYLTPRTIDKTKRTFGSVTNHQGADAPMNKGDR